MIEKAIYITKIGELNLWVPGYTRIYFGNEFCERLIPEPAVLKEVTAFAKEKQIDISLVTGYLTDVGIGKVAGLLEIMAAAGPGSEVVVNDWGVMVLAKQFKQTLILGRLLAKQSKGPNVVSLLKFLPDQTQRYFREPCMNDPFFFFLKEHGFGRFELDNIYQGVIFPGDMHGLKVSLYYPYGYVATSRFCFSNPNNRRNGRPLGIYPCSKECQRSSFVLNNRVMNVPLYVKGNTVFFKNDNDQWIYESSIIDRIIYQPAIPV